VDPADPCLVHLGARCREPSAGSGRLRLVPAPSASLDTAALRKARGAFFTPEPLARYVTEWAVRSVADKVLEPSCGEAAFLLSAVDRLAALHDAAHDPATPHLDGVELHDASASAARDLLREAGVEADVRVGDFFTFDPTGTYDVVIGNPPYVRYQDFSGESRARSREAALRAGVPISNLASSWAAFTIHSALFLRKGGRLGLVLPAELLTVNYAAAVRRFLLERFASVDLVLFEERVFPEAEVEVVLLLAEGYDEGPTDHFRVFQSRDADDLADTPVVRSWTPEDLDAKWTPSLLSSDALSAFSSLTHGEDFATLQTWGETTLGMVTGNNRYFALSPQRVAEIGLAASDLVRLSPPGSRHLRGLTLTESALDELGAAGSSTWLFRPAGEPSKAARRYIDAGEVSGVNNAYKCRIRPNWWRVPLVPPADLLLTYMNADTPRLCTNRAKVHHLNSVHGVYTRPEVHRLAMDYLPLASINSMTLVGAETVGRAYGGGMLKIEPREADRLPMPSPALVESVRKGLAEIRSQMRGLLVEGRLADAARLVDDLVLVGALGMKRSEVNALRDAHADLTARRVARSGRTDRRR
jgi:adenine-specific DNA-methyltransferase